LTEIGLQHFTFCVKTLSDIENERELATRHQTEPRGEIRLLAPKSFGNQFLAPLVAEFVGRHEGIKISMLLSDDSPAGLDLIENGVDLAIRISEISNLSMIGRRIGSLHLKLCASPAYLGARGIPHKPIDLKQHDCVLHLKYFPDGDWCFAKAGRSTRVKVTGRFSANSSLAVRAAALQGLGIALLPDYCVTGNLLDGSLRQVLPDYQLPDHPIYALYPHQRLLTAKVRLLLDFLIERFSETQSRTQNPIRSTSRVRASR
jgi:DNA-binding transcriptional LysR family regulator